MVLLASLSASFPCGIDRARFALVGGGAVRRTALGAFVAGEVTLTPERSGGRTLRVGS